MDTTRNRAPRKEEERMSEESPKDHASPRMQATIEWGGLDRLPGAVLVCDALGFKGLWRGRYGVLFDALDSLRERVKVSFEVVRLYAEFPALNVHTGLFAFSDTLAFTVRAEPKQRCTELEWEKFALPVSFRAVQAAALTAVELQHAALQIDPPLAYRGSIAFGPFMEDVSQQILIGEAVDEAGSDYECSEGAFIRLTPSARSIVDDFVRDAVKRGESLGPKNEPSFLTRYEVPLKGVGPIDGWVVNPLGLRDPEEHTILQPGDFIRRMRATFDRAGADPRVEKMWQNTRKFLESLRSS
jgi:hypothetical protein